MVSETSIREGLLSAMSMLALRDPVEDLLSSLEDEKRHALMCSLFSAIAIGGLMLGCPVATVARHMDFARHCKEQFNGFADKTPTVPALILYAMSHAFIVSEHSDQEHREALLQARDIQDGCQEVDPLVSCFLAYREFHDRIEFVTLSMIESHNPFSAVRRVMNTKGMVLRTDRAKRVREEIDRGEQYTAQGSHGAHPSFVLVDSALLVLRFANTIGDGSAAFEHVHNYLASELERLAKMEAGAMVLNGVADLLIEAKARLLRTDGLLPLADLISNSLHDLPGLGRYDKGLVAVQSLAVFRLLEQRERYGSLREIINTAGPFDIPAFDECLPGVPLCGVPVVNHTCGLILKLRSLDGVVGVRSAAILAELEARGEPR